MSSSNHGHFPPTVQTVSGSKGLEHLFNLSLQKDSPSVHMNLKSIIAWLIIPFNPLAFDFCMHVVNENIANDENKDAHRK